MVSMIILKEVMKCIADKIKQTNKKKKTNARECKSNYTAVISGREFDGPLGRFTVCIRSRTIPLPRSKLLPQ